MKKLFLFSISLLFVTTLFAQELDIIYTEFDPPVEAPPYTWPPHDYCYLNWDIDGDSVIDMEQIIDKAVVFYDVWMTDKTPWNLYYLNAEIEDDTISHITNWQNMVLSTHHWFEPAFPYELHMNRICLRKTVGDDYYYGWFNYYYKQYPTGIYTIGYIDRMAFCPIPNYPLRWGQVSIYDSVDETEAEACVLYPNPTDNNVTLRGTNIKNVAVYNFMGELVFTKSVNQSETILDMSNLAIGLYYVRIIGTDGKQIVRKIVKK